MFADMQAVMYTAMPQASKGGPSVDFWWVKPQVRVGVRCGGDGFGTGSGWGSGRGWDVSGWDGQGGVGWGRDGVGMGGGGLGGIHGVQVGVGIAGGGVGWDDVGMGSEWGRDGMEANRTDRPIPPDPVPQVGTSILSRHVPPHIPPDPVPQVGTSILNMETLTKNETGASA